MREAPRFRQTPSGKRTRERSTPSTGQAIRAGKDLHERMGRFLERDEECARGALRMKEGLEHEPKLLQGWLGLKSMYGRREWSAEEIEVVKESESLSPSSTLPASFWASRYRSLGNLAK